MRPSLIDPNMTKYPHSTPPGNIRKLNALQHFQGDTKPEDRQDKGQVTKEKKKNLDFSQMATLVSS